MKVVSGLRRNQVLQRLKTRGATARLSGACRAEGEVRATIFFQNKALSGFDDVACGSARAGDFLAVLKNIPTGGPYALVLTCGREHVRVSPFYSGDVWILAGQSNMEGVGNLSGAARPHPLVKAFSMRRVWRRAADPLHVKNESPDACHHGAGQCSPADGERLRRNARRGVGVGVFFGREMVARTGVPQGLICTAHGGTSMHQWSPEHFAQGSRSLYWSMITSVRETDQPVAGVLWYQGESDAFSETAPLYTERMRDLVEATRQDLRQPNLPWVTVQIARCHGRRSPSENAAWNAIQNHQRLLPLRIAHLETVSVIDLPMDDFIHLGSAAFPALSRRLAEAVQDLRATGRSRRRPPQWQSIRQLDGRGLSWRFAVAFSHVKDALSAPGAAAGFAILDEEGNEIPAIFDTHLQGREVHLSLMPPPGLLPRQCLLSYGHGSAPICNISDGRGYALPVFGPVPLSPPAACSRFFSRWRASGLVPGNSYGDPLPPPPTMIRTTAKRYGADGLVGGPNEPDQTGHGYYFSSVVLTEPMKVDIRMGYDGPFALWLGQRRIFQDRHGTYPCVPDKAVKAVCLPAGRHELCVVMEETGGGTLGFYLRMIRTDIPEGQQDVKKRPLPRQAPPANRAQVYAFKRKTVRDKLGNPAF